MWGITLSSSPPHHSFQSRPVIMLVLGAEIAFCLAGQYNWTAGWGRVLFLYKCFLFLVCKGVVVSSWGLWSATMLWSYYWSDLYVQKSWAVLVMEVYDSMIEWPPGRLHFHISPSFSLILSCCHAQSIEFISVVMWWIMRPVIFFSQGAFHSEQQHDIAKYLSLFLSE